MKLGRSYTVDVLLPDAPDGILAYAEIPDGFRLLPNGRGAVRITARDRDRIGDVMSLEHLFSALCFLDLDLSTSEIPLCETNAEWHERFRHGR